MYKLMSLCEGALGDQTAIRHCLNIARTLQESSMTIKALTIGIGIERKVHTAIDPDSAENLFAARKRAVHQKSGMCAVPVLLQGRGEVFLEDATIAEISSAWLQGLHSLGEAQAMQGAAEREYALYPKAYASNPSNCPDVLAMSSAVMAEYLGTEDPALVPEFWLQ